jgi:hypothetical protein
MANVLNSSLTSSAVSDPRVASYAYTGGSSQIWGQDSIAAPKVGLATGYNHDAGSDYGQIYGQIYPTGIY